MKAFQWWYPRGRTIDSDCKDFYRRYLRRRKCSVPFWAQSKQFSYTGHFLVTLLCIYCWLKTSIFPQYYTQSLLTLTRHRIDCKIVSVLSRSKTTPHNTVLLRKTGMLGSTHSTLYISFTSIGASKKKTTKKKHIEYRVCYNAETDRLMHN